MRSIVYTLYKMRSIYGAILCSVHHVTADTEQPSRMWIIDFRHLIPGQSPLVECGHCRFLIVFLKRYESYSHDRSSQNLQNRLNLNKHFANSEVTQFFTFPQSIRILFIRPLRDAPIRICLWPRVARSVKLRYLRNEPLKTAYFVVKYLVSLVEQPPCIVSSNVRWTTSNVSNRFGCSSLSCQLRYSINKACMNNSVRFTF